jgi:hypothetical protein
MDKNRRLDTPKITDGSITPELIINTVADYFDLPKQELLLNQKRKYCVPRQICTALMHSYLGLTLNTIASELYHLAKARVAYHTTIRYGIKQVCDLRDTDPKMKEDLAKIMHLLENPTKVKRMVRPVRRITTYREEPRNAYAREFTIPEHEKVMRKYL